MSDLSDRLKLLRKSNGLTQVDVATRLGITKSAISSYEQGSNEPPIDIVAKLAVIYNTSSDYILGINNKYVINILHLSSKQKRAILTIIDGLSQLDEQFE